MLCLEGTAFIETDLENESNISIWILKEDCKLCHGEGKELHGLNETLKEQQ